MRKVTVQDMIKADRGPLPPDPQEFKREFLKKQRRIMNIAKFERQVRNEQIEFSRKPYWQQQAEEGDYMADGSDLQGWE